MLGRFSIRWRLAIISSALTFLVLCGFAIVVGQLTTGMVRSSFDSETANSATELSGRLRLPSQPTSPTTYRILPDINVYAASNNAAIRLFDQASEAQAEGDQKLDGLSHEPGAEGRNPSLSLVCGGVAHGR